MKRTGGFTMIELLIALAITAILAAIAYPSYRMSALKTRRSDGIAAALAIQAAQEKFRGNCPYYAQNLGSSDVCGASAGASTVAAGTTSNGGYYALSIEAGSAGGNAYTIVAIPTGAQMDDTGCSPMKIVYNAANPNGVKTPADCW